MYVALYLYIFILLSKPLSALNIRTISSKYYLRRYRNSSFEPETFGAKFNSAKKTVSEEMKKIRWLVKKKTASSPYRSHFANYNIQIGTIWIERVGNLIRSLNRLWRELLSLNSTIILYVAVLFYSTLILNIFFSTSTTFERFSLLNKANLIFLSES